MYFQNGVDLYYEVHGQGDPLVLIAGLTATDCQVDLHVHIQFVPHTMKAGMLARIFLYHATLGTSAISFIFLVALNFRAL